MSSTAGLAAANAARTRARAASPMVMPAKSVRLSTTKRKQTVVSKPASSTKRKRTDSRSSLGVGDGRGPAPSPSKRSKQGRNLRPSPRLRFPGES
jgi:hypothetical protein